MDLMLILPLALLVVMMIFMWRSNKKRQEQQQEMRSQLTPGTEVMTQAGIYGTLVELDEANNVAVLESTPGCKVRVHSATILNVVTPVIPDDASSLTSDESADTDIEAEYIESVDADAAVDTDATVDAEAPVDADAAVDTDDELPSDDADGNVTR